MMAPMNKDMYAMYLRKSRKDMELEAMGEGETLARQMEQLEKQAAKLTVVEAENERLKARLQDVEEPIEEH